MSDTLWDGRRFRTFNVVDDFSREALPIEIDLNLPAARVIRVLDRIAAWRGYPRKLRLDNGPELVSITLAEWAEAHGVELCFIQPGKPMQNGFVERFNGIYRRGVLDMYVFRTPTEVREQTEIWLLDYSAGSACPRILVGVLRRGGAGIPCSYLLNQERPGSHS